MSIWVYQQTGSIALFARMAIFALLPGILVLPFSGTLADRWDRRKIMITMDTISAVFTLGIAYLFFLERVQLWHIFVVTAVNSITAAFQRPAYDAAVVQLVPKRFLGRVAGFNMIGNSLSIILAPGLAALLMVTIGMAGIFIIDLLTFLVAVLALIWIPFPDTLYNRRVESFFREIAEGFKYILTNSSMLSMVILFILYNFIMSIVFVLRTPWGLSFSSLEQFGKLISYGGVGVLLGVLIMGIWGGTKRRAHGMLLFMLLEGCFFMIMAIKPSPWFYFAGILGGFTCFTLMNAHWRIIIQTKVNPYLQGRVFSINQMIAWSMMPVGFYIASSLVDTFQTLTQKYELSGISHFIKSFWGADSYALAFSVFSGGVLVVLVALAGIFYKKLYRIEDYVPDYIAGAEIETIENNTEAI